MHVHRPMIRGVFCQKDSSWLFLKASVWRGYDMLLSCVGWHVSGHHNSRLLHLHTHTHTHIHTHTHKHKHTHTVKENNISSTCCTHRLHQEPSHYISHTLNNLYKPITEMHTQLHPQGCTPPPTLSDSCKPTLWLTHTCGHSHTHLIALTCCWHLGADEVVACMTLRVCNATLSSAGR